MQPDNSKTRTTFVVLTSAVCGTVVATGMLAIGVVITAAVRGYSLVDLYMETFPSFRGPATTSIPTAVYVIFFLYVLGAVEVAMSSRHLLSKRWRAARK